MNEGLIPHRYAKALYKVALERGEDKALYDLCGRLTDAFAAEPAFQQTVANPFVSDSDKLSLLMTAAGATDKDRTYCDFLKLLADNGRIGFAAAVARDYRAIYRRQNNIYRVDVVSAGKLDPSEEERLKKLIQDRLDGGKMEYSSTVDSSLIGGFTVNIDNRRLDASVKNQLKQLRLALLN